MIIANFKSGTRYEVIKFIGLLRLLGFVGLLGLLEFIELLELRAQILYETRIHFGNDFSLIINPFKIILVDILLIQRHIELALNFGS